MVDVSASALSRTSPLTAAQKDRLSEIQKFLVNIADGSLGVPAASHGYDGEEHRLGWVLWNKAAGADRPLEHSLTEVQLLIARAPTPAVALRFRVLDDFENRWFPRMRNAIRRFVAIEKRHAVAEAFFQDLSQQPLGPGVVSSVDRFLTRYADFARSGVPGARDAVAALEKKGLNEELLASIRAVVDEAKDEAPKAAAPSPSADAIEAASRAQVEAYDKLNDWYIDWADTLRAELGYHAALRLGITSARRKRRLVGDPANEPTPTE